MDFIRRAALHLIRALVRAFHFVMSSSRVQTPMAGSRTERIVVLLDSGVGDTLMATPMLRELRGLFSEAILLAAVDLGTAQVLRNNPDIDGLCVFRNSGMSARLNLPNLRSLKKFRPDVMVVPQTGNTLMQVFAACYPGSPLRIKHRFDYPDGRRYGDYEFLFTHAPRVQDQKHRVEDNLALLEPLGWKKLSNSWPMVFRIQSWDRERACGVLKTKGWRNDRCTICVHPGVGTATLKKQWPREKFVELGRQLVTNPDVQIVLVGGKAEAELCQTIAREIGSACFVVAGECTLAETGAVIELSRLFVSNDSGLMHLAATIGARGVAIFGTTHPSKIGPWGGEFRIVRGSVIDDIPVAEVRSACMEFLRDLPMEKAV